MSIPTDNTSREDVAIVGLSCRFPGGIETPAQLWDFVEGGRHISSDFPPDRPLPDLIGFAAPEAMVSFAPKGGFIDNPGEFDAEFFGISPREAKAMDPQQRIALELCWQSLENAAINPHNLRSTRTGVYIGAMSGDYAYLAVGRQDLDPGYIATGASQSVLSGRISYLLGFEGPSMTIDTACSSSLVALHLAAQGLRFGECELALVGGVTIMSTLTSFYALGQHGAVSRDGRSKAYSADADGFCVAEGCAVLVLERLDEAIRNRRRIHGVIRGSAVNQDGASNGLTAPSAPAQMNLIRDALSDAALGVLDVDVVEGHGTGTPVGDPLELEALFATYGQERPHDAPLLLGSIKSNIGHAQAAAGMAGVIKMVEAMRRGVVPATLNVTEPTSSVDWSAGTVQLVTESQVWPDRGRARRCGVSSFGISGTNAHIILEQPPGEPPTTAVPSDPTDTIWVISGRSETARAAQATSLLTYLRQHPELDPTRVGHALATTRAAFEHRAAIVGSEMSAMLDQLAAIAENRPIGAMRGTAMDHKPVFVFSGQGGYYPGIGARLMSESGVFAGHVRNCDEMLAEYIDWSVADTLTGGPNSADPGRANVIQPLWFVTMTGLAKLWQSMGVEPAAVIGHSQGEVAAAHVAGVLTLRDAVRIIALRSKAIATLSGTGAMASVNLPHEEIDGILEGLTDISIAAINSTRTTVISGGVAEIDEVGARCEAKEVRFRKLDVDLAGHSRHFDVLRDEVEAVVASVCPQPGSIPIFSTVTGDVIDPQQLGPQYWFLNMRQTVLFNDALESAYLSGYSAFLEMRTQPVLTPAIYEFFEDQGADSDFAFAIASGSREDDGMHGFMKALANAQVRGITPDWQKVFGDIDEPALELPGYAFQRENYWLGGSGGIRGGSPSALGLADPEHPLFGAIVEVPAADRYHFSARISVADYSWLADHALNGNILVPGAMLLELALQAGHKVGNPRVDKLTMHTPIALPKAGAVQLQLIVGEPAKNGCRVVSIYSRPEPDESSATDPLYTLHADGLLAAETGDASEHQALEFWPPVGAESSLDTEQAYLALRALGYEYGPVFQGMKAVWRRGDEVFAEVELPDSISDADQYGLHPALLDSAMQTMMAAAAGLTDVDGGAIALPYRWEYASLFAIGATALRVRLTPAGKNRVRWLLCDTNGRPVATGILQVRTISFDKLAERGLSEKKESLLRIDWMRIAAPQTRYNTSSGQWVVVGNHSATGIAASLSSTGELDPYGDLGELVTAVDLGKTAPSVVIWTPDDCGVELHLRDRLLSTLEQLQLWFASESLASTKLVVIGCGAHTRENATDISNLAGAAAWGLLRSIQSEYPDRIVQLDVDDSDVTLDTVAAAIASEEPELLLRDGEMYGRRIQANMADVVCAGQELHSSWELSFPNSGNLEDVGLVAATAEEQALPAGSVLVELRAAGITFPAVLSGLDAADGFVAPIKHEAAGIVRAVAPDVSAFAVGDHVFGLFDAVRSSAITDYRLLAHKPSGWSFAEAATAPVSYLTAAHALHMAQPQATDSILVHCATSGVGLATVHLARRRGLEVFATANQKKWKALSELGLAADHIGDSRSVQFKSVIETSATVDIVVNMLPAEFTDVSLSLLSDGGRFVEIGRAEVRDAAAVRTQWPGVQYESFELAALDPERIAGIFSELSPAFHSGELPPLPVTCFDVRQAGLAMRYTSESRHTGKVALTWPIEFDPDKTVLITGGTGIIGRIIARHMVSRYGARHLLLTSRSGRNADGVDELVDELSASGAHVQVAACDISDKAALGCLLSELPIEHPLGAVVHLAASIADATLPSLSKEHVDAVLPAKAVGAQNLDELTVGCDLSMFVLFSSAAGAFGAPGQANYAAANTFVDAVAQRRYHRGLPATSMAWGWWAEVSSNTSGLDEKDKARLTRLGIFPMEPKTALEMFDSSVDTGLPHLIPIGINLGLLRAAAAVTDLPPLFRALLHLRPRATQKLGDSSELAKRLTGLDPTQQHSMVMEILRTPIAMVLGYSSPGDVPSDREFHEMGIDSLSSIELGTHLRAITGLKLANSVIFEYPTISLLARHVLTQLAPDDLERSDPVVAELELLLGQLSEIHSKNPIPEEVFTRLSRSFDRLRTSDADLTPQMT